MKQIIVKDDTPAPSADPIADAAATLNAAVEICEEICKSGDDYGTAYDHENEEWVESEETVKAWRFAVAEELMFAISYALGHLHQKDGEQAAYTLALEMRKIVNLIPEIADGFNVRQGRDKGNRKVAGRAYRECYLLRAEAKRRIRVQPRRTPTFTMAYMQILRDAKNDAAFRARFFPGRSADKLEKPESLQKRISRNLRQKK